MTRRHIVYAVIFLVILLVAPAQAILLRGGGGLSINEEFVGPFPTWVNVKSACGATGNGTTDDTAAIQTCLNGITSSAPVLYFPAGTYKTSDVSTTGTASASSTTLTVASGSGIVNGMEVNATNIPLGDTVTAGGGTTTLTLRVATTGSLSSTPATFNLGLSGQQYIGIIGQDPSNTTILWAGSSGGTMLYINGVSFSRFDRLTFNGQGNAAVAVDQSKADGPSNYFDTGNEYTDDVFENSGTGIRCGNLGYGCAETSVLRDKFLNNTLAGIAMENPNALDMWVWYSFFQNNATGVTNQGIAGDFSIYESVFLGSTSEDIQNGNTGQFVYRNNYSLGSNYFVNSGGTGAPDNIVIQDNIILDTTQALSIWQNDPGPVVLLDNIIRTSATAASVGFGSGWSSTAAAGPAVIVGNCNGVGGSCTQTSDDLFAMGNTYSVGTGTCSVGTAGSGPASPAFSPGHCHEINDQVVSPGTINPSQPVLPGTPPNYGRTIFEAAPSGNSGNPCTFASPCDPQTAITQAALGCANNVAHLEPGTYSISTTLTVPANCLVQIIGDGSYSLLNWTGGSTPNAVLQLVGPSKATLDSFAVSGAGNSVGIDITDADQVGARIYMVQPWVSGSSPNLLHG